jgi:sensor histidine kinase regulating citrate/malate metabolism
VAVSVWADNELVVSTVDDAAVVAGMVTDEQVRSAVMVDQRVWSGRQRLGPVDYLAAYAPMVDHDQVAVGMISVGVPQIEVFSLASEALRVTFGVTIGLILVSLIPTYIVARQLTYQLS